MNNAAVVLSRTARRFSNLSLLLAILFSPAHSQYSQPEDLLSLQAFSLTVPDVYQFARNMALTGSAGPGAGPFCIVRAPDYPTGGDTSYFAIVPEDRDGYFIYNVNDPSNPTLFGKILLDSATKARDVVAAYYQGSETPRLFFVQQRRTNAPTDHTRLISIDLSSDVLDRITQAFDTGRSYHVLPASANVHIVDLNHCWNVEMLHLSNGKLFVAANIDTLYYYDVSTDSSFARYDLVSLHPANAATLQDLNTAGLNAKLHEVKTCTHADGTMTVGCPLVRAGMCVLTLNGDGSVHSRKWQYYDNDRTRFPDTVINPDKAYYDPTDWTGEHGHKWDFTMCHSALPYEHENKTYILTSDEYSPCYGYNTIDTSGAGRWGWERLEYYLPNGIRYDSAGGIDTVASGLYVALLSTPSQSAYRVMRALK